MGSTAIRAVVKAIAGPGGYPPSYLHRKAPVGARKRIVDYPTPSFVSESNPSACLNMIRGQMSFGHRLHNSDLARIVQGSGRPIELDFLKPFPMMIECTSTGGPTNAPEV